MNTILKSPRLLLLIAMSGLLHAEAPKIAQLDPVDGDYTFGSRENVLVATFDRAVGVNQGGTIEIRDLTDGSSSQTINLPSSQVTFEKGNRMMIHLGDHIELGTDYSVRISKDALSDGDGKTDFAGILDDTTWNFRTVRKLHNVLVVTIAIKDGPPNRTVKQAVGELFTNKENVDEAFRIASYGDLGLVLGDGSDKSPIVEMNWPDIVPDAHRKKNFRLRAQEELVKRGYDLGKYRFICYIMPRTIAGPDGSASVGGQWSNYKVFWIGTIIHEIGHCLGAQHSIADPGCVMGPWHENFSAAIKDHFGWLDPFPGSVIKVKESASHTLVSLNKYLGRLPGLRVVNVSLPNGEFLCVSYRVQFQPYGRIKKSEDHSNKIHISFLPRDARSRSHFKGAFAEGESLSFKGVTIRCDQIGDDKMSAKISINYDSDSE